MFRGTSNHSLDGKGRLIIPARFREVLDASAEKAVMVTAWDNAIYAYTLSEWSVIEQNALNAKRTATMQKFIRFFIGCAHKCALDAQERILIPSDLRRETKLEKEVVLIGSLTRFEIWSKENLKTEKDKMLKELKQEDNQSEIDAIGI